MLGKNSSRNYIEITLHTILSPCLLIAFFLCLTHTISTETSGLSLQNAFRQAHHHHWLLLKKKCTAVFPLYDLLTSKWEHKKALWHWKNGRVIGHWLTCCLCPQDSWETRVLLQCFYPHDCYTIYGLHWVLMGLRFMALHLVRWRHCCQYWKHGVKDGVSLPRWSRVGSQWLTWGWRRFYGFVKHLMKKLFV